MKCKPSAWRPIINGLSVKYLPEMYGAFLMKCKAGSISSFLDILLQTSV